MKQKISLMRKDTVFFDDELIDFLMDKITNNSMGARPIRRLIQNHIENETLLNLKRRIKAGEKFLLK